MEKGKKILEIKERARANFSLGYNCAECVFEAVISMIDTGFPQEIQKLATGFGGGVGLYGDTCGAISGAVMAVGAIVGDGEFDPAYCTHIARQEEAVAVMDQGEDGSNTQGDLGRRGYSAFFNSSLKESLPLPPTQQ